MTVDECLERVELAETEADEREILREFYDDAQAAPLEMLRDMRSQLETAIRVDGERPRTAVLRDLRDQLERFLADAPQFNPHVHLLREFSVWLDFQSEQQSEGELCYVCGQARCAPTCLRVRTLEFLAGAPAPTTEHVCGACVTWLRAIPCGCGSRDYGGNHTEDCMRRRALDIAAALVRLTRDVPEPEAIEAHRRLCPNTDMTGCVCGAGDRIGAFYWRPEKGAEAVTEPTPAASDDRAGLLELLQVFARRMTTPFGDCQWCGRSRWAHHPACAVLQAETLLAAAKRKSTEPTPGHLSDDLDAIIVEAFATKEQKHRIRIGIGEPTPEKVADAVRLALVQAANDHTHLNQTVREFAVNVERLLWRMPLAPILAKLRGKGVVTTESTAEDVGEVPC